MPGPQSTLGSSERPSSPSRLVPEEMGAFEFVVLSAQRVAQLTAGCLPMVAGGDHKPIVVAQMEVAARCVRRLIREDAALPVVVGDLAASPAGVADV